MLDALLERTATREPALALALAACSPLAAEVLRHGADVDATVDGVPLLHTAAAACAQSVALLLDAGADARVVSDGRTAADAAALAGSEDSVMLLLRRGVDCDACLPAALEYDWASVAEMLVLRGLSPCAPALAAAGPRVAARTAALAPQRPTPPGTYLRGRSCATLRVCPRGSWCPGSDASAPLWNARLPCPEGASGAAGARSVAECALPAPPCPDGSVALESGCVACSALGTGCGEALVDGALVHVAVAPVRLADWRLPVWLVLGCAALALLTVCTVLLCRGCHKPDTSHVAEMVHF